MHDSADPITVITDLRPEPAPIAQAPRQATLTVLRGQNVGAVFTLEQAETVLGRGDEADVVVDETSVSRRHARVLRVGRQYEIEDLGSQNGTHVGGARVERRTRLVDGARVFIGRTVLRFALQDALERDMSQRIYELSVRDPLTGAFNRRYFTERMESEVAYAVRHETALSVLMVDIDHFKRVNDTYGHAAGDRVLRELVEVLRGSARTEDVVARLGGEELAVVARGIDVAGASRFAERLRELVERMNVRCDGVDVRVTVSIGVAHNQAGVAMKTPTALVAAADGALYAAKRSGRNRVQLAASPGQYLATQNLSVEHVERRTRS